MKKILVITDPCYMKHSTSLMSRDTIYGDWSCMVYKGNRKENKLPQKWNEVFFKFFSEYNSEPLKSNKEEREKRYKEYSDFKENWLKEHCLGEFCADAGMVGVYNWEYMSKEDKEWCEEHPWCAAIIKDFDGEVNFEIEDDTVYVVGKGNFDFFSTQSGF